MKKCINIFKYVLVCLFLQTANSCKDDLNQPSDQPELKKAKINYPGPKVKDIDGNVYHSVKIGTQVWMVENLKVTHYRNGDPIAHITDTLAWINLKTPAYCDYRNGPINSLTYGRLYNWYAVSDSRNIAPKGWHVPSNAEWQTLMLFLDPNAILKDDIESLTAGGKLKESGTAHWFYPNVGASNESGFTALPGGVQFGGTYAHEGIFGYWWTSTMINDNSVWCRNLFFL